MGGRDGRRRWMAFAGICGNEGVHNANRLLRELQKRGYAGGRTQVGQVVQQWREEGRERAFVRFETEPQSPNTTWHEAKARW
jgi:hypothetical protein